MRSLVRIQPPQLLNGGSAVSAKWIDLIVGATLACHAYRNGSSFFAPTETEQSWREMLPSRLEGEIADVHGIHTYQNSGADAFTCRTDNGVFWIVIRGTDCPWDWVRDVHLQRVDGPLRLRDEYVHRTWLDDAVRLWSHMKIAKSARRAVKRGDKIHIVGHSLGAATGCLMAALAVMDDLPVDLLMAISCPRVGTENFSAGLAARIGPNNIYRFTRCRDAVCRVPFRRCGWRHVGQNHYFDRFGEYHQNPSRGFVAFDRASQKLNETVNLKACDNSAWLHHDVNEMRKLITQHARSITR